VLLVDDDMGQGTDVTAALRDTIKANAASALVWNTQTQGNVPLSELRRAQVVVWATGDQYQNTITGADQGALAEYLQGGGKLIVTGQDIGYDIGTSAFYTNFLKTRFLADSSGTTKFVTTGAFGNTAFTLNAQGSAGNQYYPDVIADLNGSVTVAGWGSANATAGTITAQSLKRDPNKARATQKQRDPRGRTQPVNRAPATVGELVDQLQSLTARVIAQSAGDNAGAIVVNNAGTYRTVNMGFGMEGLTPNSRNLLMKTALEWLMR